MKDFTQEELDEEIKRVKNTIKNLEEASKKLRAKKEATISTRLERLGVYEPEKGNHYFYINEINDYEERTSINSESIFIKELIDSGNIYKTKKDAQAAAKRREIMADLWRNSKVPKIGEYNYFIYVDEDGRVEKSADEEGFDICKPYFTPKKASEMIKKHGDDLKLLLI